MSCCYDIGGLLYKADLNFLPFVRSSHHTPYVYCLCGTFHILFFTKTVCIYFPRSFAHTMNKIVSQLLLFVSVYRFSSRSHYLRRSLYRRFPHPRLQDRPPTYSAFVEEVWKQVSKRAGDIFVSGLSILLITPLHYISWELK